MGEMGGFPVSLAQQRLPFALGDIRHPIIAQTWRRWMFDVRCWMLHVSLRLARPCSYASNTFLTNSLLRRWFSTTERVILVPGSIANSTVNRRGRLCALAYWATAA